jgi:hypothetical protein
VCSRAESTLRLGSYIWHAAQNASTYTSLTFNFGASFSWSILYLQGEGRDRQYRVIESRRRVLHGARRRARAPAFTHRLALDIMWHDVSLAPLFVPGVGECLFGECRTRSFDDLGLDLGSLHETNLGFLKESKLTTFQIALRYCVNS